MDQKGDSRQRLRTPDSEDTMPWTLRRLNARPPDETAGTHGRPGDRSSRRRCRSFAWLAWPAEALPGTPDPG